MGSTGLFLTAWRRWTASFCDASPAPHTDKNTVSECCFPVNLGAPRWERYSLSAASRDYSARLRSHPVVPYNWIWRCSICLCSGDVLSFSCCAATFPLDTFSSKQQNNSFTLHTPPPGTEATVSLKPFILCCTSDCAAAQQLNLDVCCCCVCK